VYKKDKNGKEPRRILMQLIALGVVIVLPCVTAELYGSVLTGLITYFAGSSATLQLIVKFIDNIFIVALAEEGFKYLALKLSTWNKKFFSFKYDGIVYAVFMGLGFAALENIAYVFQGGLSTAIARALTAIPGHCSFAIIMGTFYGSAKYYESIGQKDKEKTCLRLAFILPIFAHGLYDFIITLASEQEGSYTLLIAAILYIILLFTFSFIILFYQSKHDAQIVDNPDAHPLNKINQKGTYEQNKYYQPPMNL
jgi:RsiW-degrading membrane proteinase PrsW (M82 family)